MSVLDPQAIFSAFNEAEETLPVAAWEIGGLKVWPLVRNYHAYWLCSTRAFGRGNQIAQSGSSPLRRVRQLARTMADFFVRRAADSAHNDHVRPADVLIAAHSSTRYFKVDGNWYNPYSDSVAKHLHDHNLSPLVLEFTGDGKYLTPRFGKSIYVQGQSYLISAKAKLGAKTGFPALPEALPGWDAFLELLDARLGPGCRPSLASVRFRARQVLGYEQWTRQLIRRTGARVGIVTGYYSTDMMGFIRAFRKEGLLSVEIQHGVQGPQHFAYREWRRLPEGGYDTLPEVFWSWSELEADYINAWAREMPRQNRAVVGGNPCLHIYDAQGRSYLGEPKAQRGDADINILFTAQAFGELPAFVMQAIEDTPNWRWWIRTHPQYVEAAQSIKASCRRFPNVVLDESDELPLTVVLNCCDVHVTEFSSSVLEAKAKGACSVVVNTMGIELFRDLVDDGTVVHAGDAAALRASIGQQAAKRTRVEGAASGQCFYAGVMKEIERAAAPASPAAGQPVRC